MCACDKKPDAGHEVDKPAENELVTLIIPCDDGPRRSTERTRVRRTQWRVYEYSSTGARVSFRLMTLRNVNHGIQIEVCLNLMHRNDRRV